MVSECDVQEVSSAKDSWIATSSDGRLLYKQAASGVVIHRNHDELELLKHKGDRNYYEFTLNKGEKKPVGTVTLELRKTDMKKNKLTVNVYSDDKKFEKKDKNTNEPLQFYSGKTPMLYELVVNSINSKNQISGYLATPKNAPVPTGR